MKWLEAHIDGFGGLSDVRLPLDKPVVIVYGPNEAGKSTLFGFIGTMLYGFAKRSAPGLRLEPLRGGRHGGRLLVADAAGERCVITRYADKAGGRAVVQRLDNLQSDEDVVEQTRFERQFLGSMNERLYRQVVAITLSDLQEINVLSGSELAHYLYDAGWDGGKAISAAEKQIAQEMDGLFRPRGANRKLNSGIVRLGQMDAELRLEQDEIERFNGLQADIAEVEAALAELERSIPAADERLSLLRKAVASRPLWLRLQQARSAREALAYSERLPSASGQGWTELLRRRDEAQDQFRRLGLEKRLLDERLDRLHVDAELLEKGAETEQLLLAAERMRGLQEQLAEQQSELQSLDETIARLVAGISPEWTERQLRELTMTIADRDYIGKQAEWHRAARQAEERSLAELESLRREEREALQEAADAEAEERRAQAEGVESAMPPLAFGPQTKAAMEEAWHALEEALARLERERLLLGGSVAEGGRRGTEERGISPVARAIVAAAGGAAAALGIAAFALPDEAATTWLVVAGALGGAAFAGFVLLYGRSRFMFRRGTAGRAGTEAGQEGRHARKDNRAADHAVATVAADTAAADVAAGSAGAARRLSRRRGAVWSALEAGEQQAAAALAALLREPERTAALLLGTDGTYSESEAVRAREQLGRAVRQRLASLDRAALLADKRERAAQRLVRIRALLHEHGERAENEAKARAAEADLWRAWLAQRSLPGEMSPTAALAAYDRAEDALQRLRQYDRLVWRSDNVAAELAAYRAQVAELCEPFPASARQAAVDPALALRLLHAEIRRQSDIRQEMFQMNKQREQLSAALEAMEARCAETAAAIAEQIAVVGMGSEEQYAAALEDRGKLRELDTELSELSLELAAGLSESRRSELEALYMSSDEEELQQARDEAQRRTEQLVAEQRALLEQRGRVRQSLEQLLQADKRRRLLENREMAAAALEADMERYAVLAVGKALLDETKRIYEEERQPEVLKKASRYFSLLTGGRYRRIVRHPDKKGLRVEDGAHGMVNGELLSRGTAEQLYMSMRLALAGETASHVQLPLLLDDLFVNFDKRRLAAAAQLVAELSQERQMVLFTCHEHIRDAVQAACGASSGVTVLPETGSL